MAILVCLAINELHRVDAESACLGDARRLQPALATEIAGRGPTRGGHRVDGTFASAEPLSSGTSRGRHGVAVALLYGLPSAEHGLSSASVVCTGSSRMVAGAMRFGFDGPRFDPPLASAS